jgi:hypothetical protein
MTSDNLLWITGYPPMSFQAAIIIARMYIQAGIREHNLRKQAKNWDEIDAHHKKMLECDREYHLIMGVVWEHLKIGNNKPIED